MTGDGSPRNAPYSELRASRRGGNNSVCVGCRSHITDQYILRVAPDLEWHAACLKCADCNQFLDETCTCFVRDGKTYCKADYSKLFGAKCPKCSVGFCRNDFVMRARNRIFHIECFRCVACSRQLVPGDEFALRDDGLFCKADHEVGERSVCGSVTHDIDLTYGNSTNINNNNTSTPNHNSSGSDNDGIVDCDEIKKTKSSGKILGKDGRSFRKSEHKTTRIRTVLNEKQLHTLRSCYTANPRPDALMKEQLVEMTGLSPRVIRVWFQNKRCKDKKRSIYLKQMHQHQEKNGGRPGGPLNGVPMVAASPVRHDSHVQPSAVEVQQYQAPWKALTDFAMQSELDHPPFQQLMHSFDMADSNDGYPSTPNALNQACHHPYMGVPPDDMSHHPHSVSSEFSGPISDMSSPISQ